MCWLSMLVRKSCDGGRVTWIDWSAVLLGDADVFGFQLGQIDSGDRLAMDDEQDAVAGEQIGQHRGGFGAFDDGIDRVDDSFEAGEALDLLDDGGD